MKFLVLSFCLCVFAFGQPAISEERIWEDFTAWLQKQAPNSKPGDLIRSYRENITKQGIADDETKRRMGVVSNFIFTRRKGVELLWGKVYAGSNPIFLLSPSTVVMTAVAGRSPGKALDIGMGQGRNAAVRAGHSGPRARLRNRCARKITYVANQRHRFDQQFRTFRSHDHHVLEIRGELREP
jgi:hypothetical protein